MGTGVKLVLAVDASAKAAAQELVSGTGADIPVISVHDAVPERRKGRPVSVLYLKGTESMQSVRSSLEKMAATDQDVALLVDTPPEAVQAFELGILCQAILPGRSKGIFRRDQFALLIEGTDVEAEPEREPEALTVGALRQMFGLTQNQLAKVADVNPRTVQNWEAQKKPTSVSRSLVDLAELGEILVDHISASDVPNWLKSENDKLHGKLPIQFLLQGRTRDLLWQLRSVTAGEPA